MRIRALISWSVELAAGDVDHHVVPVAGATWYATTLRIVSTMSLDAAAHQALGAVDGVLRVELPLALGLVADELVALVVDREDRRDGVLAALVGDELDLAVASTMAAHELVVPRSIPMMGPSASRGGSSRGGKPGCRDRRRAVRSAPSRRRSECPRGGGGAEVGTGEESCGTRNRAGRP